ANMNGIRAALQARNQGMVTALQKAQDRENGKLDTLKSSPDQTVNADLRIVACYVTMQKLDEARVMLHYLEPFAADDETKKQVQYYLALTYASQGVMDKAQAIYDDFMTKFKDDPLGESLPVAMGTGYLAGKNPSPDKAVKFFDDEARLYPHSPL